MAAASYYDFPTEEKLDVQAREIDGEVVRLQARIRGFLCRFPVREIRAETPVFIFSSANRHWVGNSVNFNCEAKAQGADQIQNASGDNTPVNGVDGISQGARAALHDPDVALKKITDLPHGWLLAWAQDGNPFFVEIETNVSTWTHPRQNDAHQVYGPNFDLQLVWKQYLAHCGTGSSSLEVETPTIGELVLYHFATESFGESTTMAPWWRESHGSLPVQSACEVCRHISFDALLHTTNAWKQTDLIPLGSLRSIAKKTSCGFCRLITGAVYMYTKSFPGDSDELVGLFRCNLVQSQQWDLYSRKIRPLYVQFELKLPWQNDALPQLSTYIKIQQILLGEERPPEQKHNESRLVKNEIDIELVKSWLHTCERKHQQMQMQHNVIRSSFQVPDVESIHSSSIRIEQPCNPVSLSDTSPELTLIDVHEECLVIANADARYIALSYVWGGPQSFQNTKTRSKQLYTPGAISAADTEIPLTIRDSIKFVGMLGERYIWIDSLCIVQDSSSDKMKQIANMGNIYSRAMLTLVVADGSSCRAGLPGVRPGSRTSVQHKELIDGMLLATELNDMHEVVNRSIWNTRGWTYQERELSKRYLYFTQSCVYFTCNQMVCKEDSGLRDVSRIGTKGLRIRTENHPVWNNYCRAVRKFTKRTLTVEEDMINAFEGIISLLQPAFKCNFLYGLPETELDVALLWQPASEIRRRIAKSTGDPAFPSWSWAGWVSKVDYVWTPHVLDDLSRVRWQVQGTECEEYITSDQLRSPKTGEHGHWEYVNVTTKSVTAYYYQPEYPEIWCLHPTAAKEARQVRALLQPGTHELRFKALTAIFCIVVKPHTISSDDYDALSSCTILDGHIRCPVEILSGDGFVAGTVYVPTQLMGSLASEPREFVCLSRRRGHDCCTVSDDVYGSHGTCDKYPQLEDDFKEASKHPTLYPKQRRMKNVFDRYDHSRYNKYKPWPLYNVMLIERKGDLAYRVAIGVVHVTAFMQAAPVEKLIILA
ncbi:hypothetical protein MMC07_004534 [Pseudocyphellaria aurata]|nr:hypothetical protein [Pseudocyphellaria aurata]